MSQNYLFRDPSLWLGRLQNILTAIGETIDQTDMQIKVRGSVSDASGMFKFQLLQIKSLKAMLENMHEFGKVILVECTADILQAKDNPQLGLLRTTFHELTTDLNLVQRALNQRLWAAKMDAQPLENLTALIEKLSPKDQKKIADKTQKFQWGQLKSVIKTASTNLSVESMRSLVDSVLDTEVRSKQTQTLIFADILANHALAPAQSLIQHTAEASSVEVVTYFTENNVSVRILPYYPDIILVGMPYSTGFLGSADLTDFIDHLEQGSKETLQPSAQIPWEFLSLPHEIGHYLFWNGVVNDKDGNSVEIDQHLRAQLLSKGLKKSDWQYHWLEELFADTFKCMLMGPIAVLGFQVLLSDAADKENLFHYNGYHPIPALRPLIASKIVQKIYPDQFPNALKQLDANWKEFLALPTWGFNIENDKISFGRDEASKVKGQWTNHQHKDQPGEDLEWGLQDPLLYQTIESDLDIVISEIVFVLQGVQKQLDTFEQDKEADSILAMLSSADSEPLSLFPWSGDLDENEGVGELIAKLLAHLGTGLKGFKVGSNQYKKTSHDYKKELEMLKKGGLAAGLKTHYLDNWGDKGPKGGNLGG